MVISLIAFTPSKGEFRLVALDEFFQRQQWLAGDRLDGVICPCEDAVLVVLRHAGESRLPSFEA